MTTQCAICGRMIERDWGANFGDFGVKYNDGSVLCHSCMVAEVIHVKSMGLMMVMHEESIENE